MKMAVEVSDLDREAALDAVGDPDDQWSLRMYAHAHGAGRQVGAQQERERIVAFYANRIEAICAARDEQERRGETATVERLNHELMFLRQDMQSIDAGEPDQENEDA